LGPYHHRGSGKKKELAAAKLDRGKKPEGQHKATIPNCAPQPRTAAGEYRRKPKKIATQNVALFKSRNCGKRDWKKGKEAERVRQERSGILANGWLRNAERSIL